MLRKVGEKELVEFHLYKLVLNEMWVEWVSGIWDSITIYNKSEPGLLFADGLKWKNETLIHGGREYMIMKIETSMPFLDN